LTGLIIYNIYGSKVPGSGFRVQSSGFMVHGSWFMVHGSWFMVHGSWFMVKDALILLYSQCETFGNHANRYLKCRKFVFMVVADRER